MYQSVIVGYMGLKMLFRCGNITLLPQIFIKKLIQLMTLYEIKLYIKNFI
jgi:hypothetical protein